MLRLVVLLCVGAVGATGCSVSFKFGTAPKPYTGPLRLQDCVHKHAIFLRPAWSSVSREHHRNPRVNRALKSRAWTFYRGGKRLSAEDALMLLRDEALSRSYRGIWRSTERRGAWMVKGSAIGLGLAAVLGVTGGIFLYDVQPPQDGSTSKGARARHITAYVFLGLAVVATVVMPILMREGYRHVRAGSAFKTVFLSTAQEPDLRKAVVRYNRRVRQACAKRLSAGS